MSTFLTKRDQDTASKYLHFCKKFGVPPMQNYEELIARGTKEVRREFYPKSPDRSVAIAIYKERCQDFNIPVAEHLDKKTTGDIWDYILRDTDKVVGDEFNDKLAEVKDFLLRSKIRIAIQTLYDEGIYIKKHQADALFNCENDNDKIQEAYKELGGQQPRLALVEMSSYLFDEEEYQEEEEVAYDEEDF